jgi:hypothetical protein
MCSNPDVEKCVRAYLAMRGSPLVLLHSKVCAFVDAKWITGFE